MADRRALYHDPSSGLAEIGTADRQVLSGDPTAALHAVPKQYVDNLAGRDVYPLSAYGFFTASDSISVFSAEGGVPDFHAARIFVPAGKAIAKVGAVLNTGGTLGTGGENSFGIYTDAGVFVASTPSDNSMWQTAGWVVRTLTTAIAAGLADRFVIVSGLVNGYTVAPRATYCIHGAAGDGLNSAGHFRTYYRYGVVSWPASFTPATYGTLTSYLPLLALG